MSKPDTWMPLYIADYLADTGHLSTEEHGAYFLLLMHAWTSGGPLPLDGERLRRIARMETKAWRSSEPVLREFFYERDGQLWHSRVDTELQRAYALVDQRSRAGKASAAKRKKEREGNDRSTSVETDEQRNGKPSPSPTQILKPAEQASTVSSTGQPPSAPPAAGKESEAPPLAPTRAGALAILLRKRGVQVTSMHPSLLGWANELQVTDEEAGEALDRARLRKPEPEPISPNYLDPIMRDVRAERGKAYEAKEARPKPWWSDEQSILAKGREVGCNPRPGEDMATYRARLNQAVVDFERNRRAAG